MNLVTLECRECRGRANPDIFRPVEFASQFMADEQPTVGEVQQHMDMFYKAICYDCGTRDWEVTKVRADDTWRLGVKPDLVLTVPAWVEEAENGPRN